MVEVRNRTVVLFSRKKLEVDSFVVVAVQLLQVKRHELDAVAVVELVLEFDPRKTQCMQSSRKTLHHL